MDSKHLVYNQLNLSIFNIANMDSKYSFSTSMFSTASILQPWLFCSSFLSDKSPITVFPSVKFIQILGKQYPLVFFKPMVFSNLSSENPSPILQINVEIVNVLNHPFSVISEIS